MERKKSKHIGDNILLYVENLEENTSIRINIKLAEYKTNILKVNHVLLQYQQMLLSKYLNLH